MTSDALFQLGMVSVSLSTSQTETSTRGAPASRSTSPLRAPARRTVPVKHLPTDPHGRSEIEVLPRSCLNHARCYAALLRGQRPS